MLSALAVILSFHQSDPAILIRHVNVIPCTKQRIIRDTNVLVIDGNIRSISNALPKLAAGSISIDGTGKYLIPGLWDMHVHGTSSPGFLGAFLANGVVGVRDMFDPYGATFKLREKNELELHIVAAGKIVDGPKPIWPGSVAVANVEEGKAAVGKVLGEGSDFVKVYSLLPRDAYFAIAEESKKRHAIFAGHVPELVTAEEASDAGQKSFEHLYGILRACSSDPKLRPAPNFGSTPSEVRPRLKGLLDTYDEGRAKKLFAKLKKNGTWQCPTFTVLYSMSHPLDPRPEQQYRFDYLPSWLRGAWVDFPKRFAGREAEDHVLQDQIFKKLLAIVGQMHKAGVPIIAGTDVMNPYCFPGFSLHDELGWLVKAGLSPLDALKCATANAARYLGRKDLGTLEAGKVADLVLLNADPLENIGNSTKIDSVVIGGKLYDRAALDKLMPRGTSAPAPPVATGGIWMDDCMP